MYMVYTTLCSDKLYKQFEMVSIYLWEAPVVIYARRNILIWRSILVCICMNGKMIFRLKYGEWANCSHKVNNKWNILNEMKPFVMQKLTDTGIQTPHTNYSIRWENWVFLWVRDTSEMKNESSRRKAAKLEVLQQQRTTTNSVIVLHSFERAFAFLYTFG